MSTALSNPVPGAALSSGWFSLLRAAFGPRSNTPTATESAQQLLDRADVYASTQPGYAADLRAAAQRMTGAD
jgi:hypothetical protein